MTLCVGDRCAPSRCGLAKPTTPTNKKTTPKILQIVFAICDPLLLSKVVNQRQRPARRPSIRVQPSGGSISAAHLYQRHAVACKVFCRAGSYTVRQTVQSRGAK